MGKHKWSPINSLVGAVDLGIIIESCLRVLTLRGVAMVPREVQGNFMIAPVTSVVGEFGV